MKIILFFIKIVVVIRLIRGIKIDAIPEILPRSGNDQNIEFSLYSFIKFYYYWTYRNIKENEILES